MSRNVFKCLNGNCAGRTFPTHYNFLFHLRTRHVDEPHLHITCGIDYCYSQFRLYESYRKHVQRKHRDNCRKDRLELDPAPPQVDEDNHESTIDADETVDEVICEHATLNDFVSNVRAVCSSYSLRIRELHALPASVHVDIISNTATIVKVALQQQLLVIKTKLNEHRGNPITSVLDEQLDDEIVDEIFRDCRSPYMLEKYCKEQLGFIQPTEHFVGGNQKVYHVPVSQVLCSVLAKEDVLQAISSSANTKIGNYLLDFTDGNRVEFLNRLANYKPVILLHFYNDEFEVVNPIGSKRGKHKLNAVYFTIGNLSPKFRSKLKYIFLALLCKHSLVTQYGYSEVFQPLIRELLQLEQNGLTVSVNGSNFEFAVHLASVSGDNLSAHGIGGFRQCFSSGRICRHCRVSYDNAQRVTSEDDVVLRTSLSHKYHVRAVENHINNVKVYGVSGKSVFSDLKAFDPVESLPPDAMHDLLEGVLPIVTRLILRRLRSARRLSLRSFNENLAHFKFCKCEITNRPEMLRKAFKIVGSASQKWCLFRTLPFLCNLDADAEVWDLYCILNKFMLYIFATRLNSDCLADIDLTATEFLEKMLVVFPRFKLTAKFHYLIHYASAINRFGPLRGIWCMRFEGKHQYFKNMANHLHNFKNVAKTLAFRHQMLLSYYTRGETFLSTGTELPCTGKSKSKSCIARDVIRMLCETDSETFWSVTEARVEEISYCVGFVITLAMSAEERVPVFCDITDIFVINEGHIDIVCKLLVTKSFNEKYQAYNVFESKYVVIHPGDELCSTPMPKYKLENEIFVVPKHYLC